MLGLGDDQNPLGFDRRPDDVGRLGGQDFLRGRLPSQNFDHPGQMRKTGDLVVAGYIGNMRFSEERQQVMLAHGIKRDVADDDQLVAVVGMVEGDLAPGIDPDPGEGFLVKIGDSPRGVDQALAVEVFADTGKDQANALDDFLFINRCAGLSWGPIPIRRL